MEMEQRQQPTFRMDAVLAQLQHWLAWLLQKLRQPFHVTEAVLVAIIGCWAISLLGNPHQFGVSALFNKMQEINPDQARWGRSALLCVLLWLVSLRWKNATLRTIAHLWLILWFAILMLTFASTGYELSGWTGILTFGALSHIVFFATSCWVLWRFAWGKHDP
jgi:hypothetical protein